MRYRSFRYLSELGTHEYRHSRNPRRGVLTQFLFYCWNLLYHNLFPSEVLANFEPVASPIWANSSI